MATGNITNYYAAQTNVCSQVAQGTIELNNVIKVGNICFLTYQLTGATIVGNGGTICRLPEGFRPKNAVNCLGRLNYGGTVSMCNITINSEGYVRTNIGSNTVTASYIRNLAFPLA